MSRLTLLIILIFSVSGCSHLGDQRLRKSNFDGVWKTQGYGYIFELKDANVKVFEVTHISCLPSGLQPSEFIRGDISGFRVTVPGFIDAFMDVRLRNENLLLSRSDTNTTMVAETLGELPDACSEVINSTLTNTSNVFVETFREHYPFFEIKGISHKTFAAAVQPASNSESSLFDSLVNTAKLLTDSHIVISAPSVDGFYWGSGQLKSGHTASSRKDLLSNFIENYALNPLIELCNEQLAFTKLKSNIGYFKVKSFNGYSKSGSFIDDLNELENALDNIFQNSSNIKSLIIDLRGNSGGSDRLGLALASRLTSKKYIAYYKQAYLGPNSKKKWSPEQPSWVTPINKPSYFGKIVLLVDYDSVSAAETFTMALMGREDVTRIGQRTRGAFSDILPRVLPNGWLVGLPNEKYSDTSGNSYDEYGIAPDINETFHALSMHKGLDNILDLAISYINSQE